MADDMNNRAAAKNAAKSAAELKKQKKKRWFPILAPETFQGKMIGEVLLDDSSQLMNRYVTVNMMQLFGDMKKQNVNIMFKVTDVKEGKGLSKAMKFEVSPFSLRRLAKREKDKRSDSFVVKTADGVLVRIKPVMVTNNMTNGAVLANLIKSCRAVCKEIVNNTKFDQLIIDLVQYNFQKAVKSRLHKVYPLKTFDIRMLAVENKKKAETVEEEMLLKLKREAETDAEDYLDDQDASEQSSQGNDDSADSEKQSDAAPESVDEDSDEEES